MEKVGLALIVVYALWISDNKVTGTGGKGSSITSDGDCNDQQCKGIEIYYPCGVPCGGQTCETVGKPCNYLKIACKGIKGACGCPDGYVRNKKNECMNANDFCNKHGDGSQTDENCTDGNGDEENNDIQCKDPNEQYYPCGIGCPQSCKDIDQPCKDVQCTLVPTNGACLCKKGYVRNKKKKCVKAKDYCYQDNISGGDANEEQCNPKHNEKFYPCGLLCQQNCENAEKACSYLEIVCNSKINGICGCCEGYVRNEKNKCVDAKDYCKPDIDDKAGNDIQCKENEKYYPCGVPCGAQTCETVGKSCNYLEVACKGIKGECGCCDGYVRNDQNKCVNAESDCKQKTSDESNKSSEGNISAGTGSKPDGSKNQEDLKKCGSNEIFYKCGRKYPETCEFINKDCNKKKGHCKPACGCLPGYVRNEAKCCVKPEEYCCGRNEERLCKLCERQCNNLNMKCDRKECVYGCYCKDGYARDGKHKCCRISKCGRAI